VVPVQVPELTDEVTSLEAAPTSSLLRSNDPEHRAELHWRLSFPLMCIVLTMLAVPMSALRPREGRYARVWVAIVVYFVYSNIVSAGKVWIARGIVPEFLGLWWIHGIAALLVLLVILRSRRFRKARGRRS